MRAGKAAVIGAPPTTSRRTTFSWKDSLCASPKLRAVPKEGWIAIAVLATGVALEIALYVGLIAAGRAWLRARRRRKLEGPQ